MTTPVTKIHLLRHGAVHNPERILYGRLPGFHLSDLGRAMAKRLVDILEGRDIVAVVSSPLERARETAEPIAESFDLPVTLDERLTEAKNVFEGSPLRPARLLRPNQWRHMRNPFQPSWGEAYKGIAERMFAALADARETASGREVLLVSHQLPIWIVRSAVEGRKLWHDPRKRECALASLTTVTYHGETIASLAYSEPAADLLPASLSPVAGA